MYGCALRHVCLCKGAGYWCVQRAEVGYANGLRVLARKYGSVVYKSCVAACKRSSGKAARYGRKFCKVG
jgi:hypothetical protein